ncbi:MAG: hypothetical protein EOO62_05635 [Hymenobacter sp.]|nr:MAG: hypothetical protein EOO62_05635 [Hymenobacter sp.]
MNQLTAQYLRQYPAQVLLFLGMGGGNGLKHIDTNKVKRVCGVDINDSTCKKPITALGPSYHNWT